MAYLLDVVYTAHCTFLLWAYNCINVFKHMQSASNRVNRSQSACPLKRNMLWERRRKKRNRLTDWVVDRTEGEIVFHGEGLILTKDRD